MMLINAIKEYDKKYPVISDSYNTFLMLVFLFIIIKCLVYIKCCN